jgi:hypothetical protein
MSSGDEEVNFELLYECTTNAQLTSVNFYVILLCHFSLRFGMWVTAFRENTLVPYSGMHLTFKRYAVCCFDR